MEIPASLFRVPVYSHSFVHSPVCLWSDNTLGPKKGSDVIMSCGFKEQSLSALPWHKCSGHSGEGTVIAYLGEQPQLHREAAPATWQVGGGWGSPQHWTVPVARFSSTLYPDSRGLRRWGGSSVASIWLGVIPQSEGSLV